MKTKSIKQLTAILVMVTALMVMMYSCKKMDSKPVIYDNETIERVKTNVTKQIAEAGGIPVIFTVNKPVSTFWGNENGIRATKSQLQANNWNSVCDGDYPTYCNLVQYTRTYRCMNTPFGYEIQFEYDISWNKNIINTNKFPTYGFITITNSGGIQVDYTISGSDVTIIDKGPSGDPNHPNDHLFKVSFRSQAIPTAYINGDISGNYTVSVSANFNTDCNTQYSLWTLPVGIWGFTTNTGLAPCDRHEKIWFQQPSIYNGHKFGVYAYEPGSVCTEYSSTFIRPDLQEVQYFIEGLTTNWQVFTEETAPTNNPIYANGFLQKTNFVNTPILPPGTYNVIIRYRNWKYSGAIPSPLVVPTLGTACQSWGNLTFSNPEYDYSTWAYEYYPGTVITP